MANPYSASLQVTISLLPVSLSLVHIPRSRLLSLVHPVIRQLLIPRPTFLNLTCNEIELSIFADNDAVSDFEVIARRDRQRHRSRSGSTSSRTHPDAHSEDAIEVSHDQWRVLQIDSHSGFDNTGARVHEISAPLAAAGISILYQSSHISDFIFVKASRLHEVLSIFSSAGYHLLSSNPDTLSSHMSPFDAPRQNSLDGTILTRRRSSTASSSGAHSVLSPPPLDDLVEEGTGGPPVPRPALTRTTSHSPAPTDVRVLNPDLSCIGLVEDSADVWLLRLVKLVAYPELIVADDGSVARVASLSPPISPTAPREAPFGDSALPSDEEPEEDGYYSASPHSRSASGSPINGVSASRSQSVEGSSERRGGKYSHLHRITTAAELAKLRVNGNGNGNGPPSSSSCQRTFAGYTVPFFSITRTDEGTSLIAPTATIAALFPASDRHMVIRGNDLDELDAGGVPEADDRDAIEEARGGPMRCLQIDLRQFGLDKHGLVNRYSRVLEENGINHMYSSTFKTANLLVDRYRARKAQLLLRDV
ncbi:hypothetical protein PENSPDRAFT_689534 [Peniophora sp. CONT]|nr:hypothetical protein PENSPDRAFT_689534 [Peniophora sp. CONT]